MLSLHCLKFNPGLMILNKTLCLCVISLDRELTDLKSRRSALMASLKNPAVEVVRPQKAGEKENIFTEDLLVFSDFQTIKESLLE